MYPSSIDRALAFASEKHFGQIRKFNGEPYVQHCIRVSDTVASLTSDSSLIIAALLHDTLEDTNTTVEELSTIFGKRVAELVLALTNDPVLVKMDKTEYLAVKVSTLNDDELLIKLADRLDNIQDLRHQKEGHAWSISYANQTKCVFLEKLDVRRLNPSHVELLDRIKIKLTEMEYL